MDTLTREQLRNMAAPVAARRYAYLENTIGRQAAEDFETRWSAANYDDECEECGAPTTGEQYCSNCVTNALRPFGIVR